MRFFSHHNKNTLRKILADNLYRGRILFITPIYWNISLKTTIFAI
jgi:hypothetical protein